jgi:hypothetical protein
MRKTLLTLSLVLLTSAAAQAQVNPGSLNAPIPAGLNVTPGALNSANPQVKPQPPVNNGGGTAATPVVPPVPPVVPPAPVNPNAAPPAAPVPPVVPPANPNAGPNVTPPATPVPPVVPPVNPPANPNGGSVAGNPNNPLPLPPAGGPQVAPGNGNNGLGLGGNLQGLNKQAIIAKLKAALAHLEQMLAQTQDPVKKAKIEKRIQKIKDLLAKLI